MMNALVRGIRLAQLSPMKPWALVLIASLAVSCHRVDPHRYVDEFKRITSRAPQWVDRDELGMRLWRVERDFYERRQYLPAWIDGRKPSPQFDTLIEALRDAE